METKGDPICDGPIVGGKEQSNERGVSLSPQEPFIHKHSDMGGDRDRGDEEVVSPSSS